MLVAANRLPGRPFNVGVAVSDARQSGSDEPLKAQRRVGTRVALGPRESGAPAGCNARPSSHRVLFGERCGREERSWMGWLVR